MNYIIKDEFLFYFPDAICNIIIDYFLYSLINIKYDIIPSHNLGKYIYYCTSGCYIMYIGYDDKQLYVNYILDHITLKLYNSLRLTYDGHIMMNIDKFFTDRRDKDVVCYYYEDKLYVFCDFTMRITYHNGCVFRYFKSYAVERLTDTEYLCNHISIHNKPLYDIFSTNYIKKILQLVIHNNCIYLLIETQNNTAIIKEELLETKSVRRLIDEYKNIIYIASINDYLIIMTNPRAQILLLDSNNKIIKKYENKHMDGKILCAVLTKYEIIFCYDTIFYSFNIIKQQYYKICNIPTSIYTGISNLVYYNNILYIIGQSNVHQATLQYNDEGVSEEIIVATE